MTPPKTLLKAWDLRPKKSLGQHFLADDASARMIVDRAGLTPSDIVLEIGAGLGALTLHAARRAKQVHALETDGRLIALLNAEILVANAANVTLHQADVLKFDIPALARGAGRPLVVLGNLPYNISSQILVRLIRARQAAARAVVMLQKELAERICAAPGGRDYGRLTVMLGYCATIDFVATVAAGRFFPKPKVDSAVVDIRFYKSPPYPAGDEKFFFSVVKAAFGQRRKTLKNALAGGDLHVDPKTAADALEASGIDPVRRAETLTVAEFVRLSNALSATNSPPPKPSGPPAC